MNMDADERHDLIQVISDKISECCRVRHIDIDDECALSDAVLDAFILFNEMKHSENKNEMV